MQHIPKFTQNKSRLDELGKKIDEIDEKVIDDWLHGRRDDLPGIIQSGESPRN
jgi:hypothetical protein